MYTFNEIRVIFARCKDEAELEKVCAVFLTIINDGDLKGKEEYAKTKAHVRFRQLKV